jgi:SOS-response transcriptional repressor LexA
MTVASLKSCEFRIAYGPSDDRNRDFFVTALSHCIHYDCMIGSFSASTLADAVEGTIHLIRNGGTMRLMAGFAVDEADVAAISGEREPNGIFLDKLMPLIDGKDRMIRRNLEILAWMTANDSLQIRFLLPRKNGKILPSPNAGGGIVPRTCIFKDGDGCKVALQGWMNDAERFFVFKSWDASAPYLEAIQQHFDNLWEGGEPGWLTMPLPPILKERLLQLKPLKSPLQDVLENVALARTEIDSRQKEKLFFQFLRDISEFLGDPVQPSASELEETLTGSETLKACWERHSEIHDAWILNWQGKRIAVTFYQESFSRHPETLRLLSYGESFLHSLLQGVKVMKSPDACQIPLIRFSAETPVPLIAYYNLDSDDIKPVMTLKDLASAAGTRMRASGPSAIAEARARGHFHTLANNQLKARAQNDQSLQRSALRKIEEKGKRILVKSALCDIARSRHATLFDQNLIAADFDEQTILRQGEKGSPLAELLSLINAGGLKPIISDPFWAEVNGKQEKTIRGIEDSLQKEARGLLRAMAELKGKRAEDANAPAIEVDLFYKKLHREKQPLMLVIAPPRKERFSRYLPFYSPAAAAEKFRGGGVVKEEGWIEVAMDQKLKKTMFVTQIKDRSMEPIIKEDSLAVLDTDVPDIPEGLILLVRSGKIDDPELGEGIAIRRFHASGHAGSGKIFRYPEIRLEPENPEYRTILLKDVASGDFQIIGRYVSGI